MTAVSEHCGAEGLCHMCRSRKHLLGLMCSPPPLSLLSQVQIKGSMVYSNYCVGVEVRARAPVSVISEGTHIFISTATSTFIILRGAQSYDPDNPGAALR